MMRLGLTPEQVAARRLGVGGSDARRICDGDWWALWMEKTGRAPPEDLSRNLAVMMGHATEPFNLHWYEVQTGRPVLCGGESRVHAEHAFMRCTLDGMILDPRMVFQAKHVSGRSPLDEVVARYTPQVQHEMLVTGCERAVLSIFMGADRYEAVEVPFDEWWSMEYLDRCKAFWAHVVENREPGQGRPLPPPPPVETFRKVSMEGNNLFADAAGRWLATRDAAKVHEAAAKDLKAQVEADVGEATGHGVRVTRDKRGLSIKEMK